MDEVIEWWLQRNILQRWKETRRMARPPGKIGALTLTGCSWGNHGNIRTQFRFPFMTSDYHPDNG